MEPTKRSSALVIRLMSIAALCLAWEVVAHTKQQPSLYPTFEQMFRVSLPSFGVFSEAASAGVGRALTVLSYHAGVTLLRISIGLLIGVPLGIIAGLIIHYLRGSGPASAIVLTIGRSIPLLALIPLFAYWFGSAPTAALAYIAVGAFFILAADTYEAAGNVAPIHAQQARLLGASRATILRTVYLPAIQTQLAGSLRNVIGLSWAFSLGAEYVSATSGLGYITYQSYLFADIGKLAILSLVYAGLGYGSYEAARRFLDRLTPWRDNSLEA
jgi:sulfonate transport system permease protein